MRIQRTTRRMAGACYLGLLIVWQSMAASTAQQPTSVDAQRAEPSAVTEQDTAVTPAGCCDGGRCSASANNDCSNGCCEESCCEPVCCPKKVTEEVKKQCWKVQPKMICIPGFRFECNWRKNKCCQSKNGCEDTCCDERCCCKDPGTPTCGRVRCINVLEKHEYTCEECGYEWEVKCVRTNQGCCPCGNGCCPSCGASGCCAANETVAADVQLISAKESTPVDEKQSGQSSLASRLMGWLK